VGAVNPPKGRRPRPRTGPLHNKSDRCSLTAVHCSAVVKRGRAFSYRLRRLASLSAASTSETANACHVAPSGEAVRKLLIRSTICLAICSLAVAVIGANGFTVLSAIEEPPTAFWCLGSSLRISAARPGSCRSFVKVSAGPERAALSRRLHDLPVGVAASTSAALRVDRAVVGSASAR
jgi:hypothetical protein